MRTVVLAVVATGLLVASSWRAWAQTRQAIQISELNGGYELTVPISRLVLRIPKEGGLAQAENTAAKRQSPRYFYFEDQQSSLIVSGWFEPAESFPGTKKLWEDQTVAWQREGLPAPRDVSFARIGGWDVVIYSMALATGSNPHIRAQWVEAGTWIDVHLSVTSDRPSIESIAWLQAKLKTFKVNVKS